MDVLSALEFAKLAPTHLPGLKALFASLTGRGDDHFFHPHPFTDAEAERLVRLPTNDLYAVACRGPAVLAYGMLRGWDEGYDVPSLGVALHPEARGTGLGRAFMHYLHAAARDRGAPSIRLKVYPDNVAAKNLYASLGYQFQPTAGEQLLGILTWGKRANVA
jgi:ribosomal protein S18 acetylase RimI-like enzyme